MRDHGPIAERRVREVLSSIENALARILDYGCGRGAWIPSLAYAFPSAEIVGLETSANALEHAKRAFPDFRFMLFDGRHAPFEDESFDLVFSYHVLEHVLDLSLTVADMARLVHAGRQVVACLPCGNTGSFEERIVRSVKGGIQCSRTGETRFFYEDEAHLRRITTARLAELFGREGCVVTDGFFTGHTWGAIQYFAAQPSITGILVDHRRARGRRAALTMLALQAGFAILHPTVRIHRTELRPRIARARGTRRLALAAAAALKPAAGVVGRALDRLAEREWHTRKREPNGSAQFLVFAKTGGSGAGAAGN